MKSVKIDELISRCTAYFIDKGYSNYTISEYQSLWNCGIVSYMEHIGAKLYNQGVGKKFEKACLLGQCGKQCKLKIRSLSVLDDILEFGYVRVQHRKQTSYRMTGPIGDKIEEFLDYFKSLRRKQGTLAERRYFLFLFCSHLKMRNVRKTKDITTLDIVSFMDSIESNRANCLTSIRLLLTYFYDRGYVDDRFYDFLNTYKIVKKDPTPSFYSIDEIKQIENSVCRSDAKGKRNYAMLLLASRLGMRISDIANLKFENFDWDKNKISIRMFKTNRIMEFPLLADVGNAIIDYLKYGRPISDNQTVFITLTPPIRSATSKMVGAVIHRLIIQSGIECKRRHRGGHALRHSLATTLLEENVSMPIISETLGHKNTQSTMSYLRIDLNSLSKCALDVPIVPKDFYEQKGGMFYD